MSLSTSLTGFRNELSGEEAFYNTPKYKERTKREMARVKPLAPSYCYQSEHSSFSFNFMHALAGRVALLPASTPQILGYPSDYADQQRSKLEMDSIWHYKRFSILVDGDLVDATVIGRISTLGNGRWVLASNGNGEFYEEKLSRNKWFRTFIKDLDANAIVFNYPGVGASEGSPSRDTMVKAYKGFLTFLEDKNKGIGAKTIVGFGHSIGGAVQTEAFKDHLLQSNIKYALVKSRTFSDMRAAASDLIHPALGMAVGVLGWGMDNKNGSKNLSIPEIILQTAAVDEYEVLTDSSKIIGDGIVSKEAALAQVLLDDPSCPKANKVFIGIPETHNEAISDPSFVAQKTLKLLKS